MREFFKRWPNFYYFIASTFGPLMYGGLSAKKFISLYPCDGLKLNLGSGPRVVAAEIKNVDLFAYKDVDIVADIANLPLPNNSVDRIICDNVLEHIDQPRKVVIESGRVLRSGGLAYFCIPFLYPFHRSPNDYNRWTKEGLQELFRDFEIIKIGTRCGPFSALAVNLCYLFATIFSFGLPTLYWIMLDLSIFIFWPIKLPDLIFNNIPNSENMAAVLYIVVKKK